MANNFVLRILQAVILFICLFLCLGKEDDCYRVNNVDLCVLQGVILFILFVCLGKKDDCYMVNNLDICMLQAVICLFV